MRVRVGNRILSLDSRDLTIFSLAKLAESRDPETGAHLERMLLRDFPYLRRRQRLGAAGGLEAARMSYANPFEARIQRSTV